METMTGRRYKLKRSVTRCTTGPEEYRNSTAELTRVLEDIEGGLFFKDGLGGMRYWNVEDVEEVR